MPARGADQPLSASGATVLHGAERRQEVEGLKDEADRGRHRPRAAVVVQGGQVDPFQQDLAAVGESTPPSRCSSVLLPDPGRAHDGQHFARFHSRD